jgi:hypothetical protein
MHKRWIEFCVVSAAITVAAMTAGAQQDEGPILRPKPKPAAKPAGATLLVLCDLACNWKLDGVAKGRIEAGGSAKASVVLGQHVISAATDDAFDKVESDVEIKAAGQTVQHLALQPVRDARLKAEQEARDRADQEARDNAAQEERDKAAQRARDQAAQKARSAILPQLVPNVGDKIPGTQWAFLSFGMSEFGSLWGSSSLDSVPEEFGINARYLSWSINLQAAKNSPGTAEASCQYFNSAGNAISAEMKSQVSLKVKDKGIYSFQQGAGFTDGYWLASGTYQIRCEIGGSPFLREAFVVGLDPLFPLVSHKGKNLALMALMGGNSERFYYGTLRVSRNGVEFKDGQGRANFQAACSEFTTTTGKESWGYTGSFYIKITHAGKSETLLAATQEEATRALQAIQAACGK